MIEQLERDQNFRPFRLLRRSRASCRGDAVVAAEKPERQDAAGSPKVAHEARGDGARGDRGAGTAGVATVRVANAAGGGDAGAGTSRASRSAAASRLREDLRSNHSVSKSAMCTVVKPGNIVGAIANEAGLEGRHIGHVDIREDHSFVDLPEGMPKEIFRELKKVRVVGRELQITRVASKPPRPSGSE